MFELNLIQSTHPLQKDRAIFIQEKQMQQALNGFVSRFDRGPSSQMKGSEVKSTLFTLGSYHVNLKQNVPLKYSEGNVLLKQVPVYMSAFIATAMIYHKYRHKFSRQLNMNLTLR